MALRELLLKLGVEVDKQGEKSALSGLEKIKAAAGAAAGAFAAFKGVQAVVGMTNEIRNMADEIDKTSQQLGLSAQALEEFRHAANLSGVDGRAMSDTLGKLQKNAYEAAEGNATLAEDFAKLGVNVKDANGEVKSGEQLMMEMADGFAGLDNETEKVGLSLGLMGRAGRKLLPMLNAGSKGIQDMRDEAKELGGVFGDELIADSVQLTDDQARLEFAMRGLKSMIAEKVMPVLIAMTQALTKMAVAARGPLTRALRFIGRIITGISLAIGWLNEKFDGLGTSLAVVAAGLGTLGVAFMLMGKTATIAAIKTAAAWVIANAPLFLMIILIGIIIAAVLLVIEDLVTMGEGGESVIGTLIQGFQDLIGEVGSWGEAMKEIFFNVFDFWFGMSQETFDAIIGNLIDFVGLMIAPLEALIGFIINLFGTIITFFTDIFEVGVAQAFVNLWDNLRFTASELVNDIINYFKGMFDFVSKGFDKVKGWLGFGDDEEAPKTPQEAARRAVSNAQTEGQEGAGALPVQAAVGTLQQAAQPGGNIAGVSAMSAVPPAAGATGGNSVVNQPQTEISVEVDAKGQSNPDDIGGAVAREVDAALQRRDRQTMQSFTEAMGTT